MRAEARPAGAVADAGVQMTCGGLTAPSTTGQACGPRLAEQWPTGSPLACPNSAGPGEPRAGVFLAAGGSAVRKVPGVPTRSQARRDREGLTQRRSRHRAAAGPPCHSGHTPHRRSGLHPRSPQAGRSPLESGDENALSTQQAGPKPQGHPCRSTPTQSGLARTASVGPGALK